MTNPSITLNIGNSYSQIVGLTSESFGKLKKILSYDIDSQAAYFSKNQYNTRKYLIDSKGSFPTGLLELVKDFIHESAIKCSIIDLRAKPTTLVTLKAKYEHAAYSSQVFAALKAVKTGRGTISMPTGTGKSMVIALIIEQLKVKTLIVVPTLEIKRQLSESLKAIFGNLKYIDVENIDSAALSFKVDYDCLIIDEAHHVAAKTYQKLNKNFWTNIYYRFFLTATPFRNNQDETLLFKALAGEVIHELSYKDAVTNGYIVPVEAYYIEMDKVKTDAYTWAEVYSELVVNNKARNDKIADVIRNLTGSKVSTLCLVKEVKHGTILSSLSDSPFVNGQDDETRVFIKDFNGGNILSLIGTTGVVGEGIDTKPCEYVIIAGLGKAKSAFMQQVGRAVRTYPGKTSAKVIIIKDKSHRFLLRHFNSQCKVLFEQYGVKPIKL